MRTAICYYMAAGALPRIQREIRKKGGELHAGFLVKSGGYVDVDPESPRMKAIGMVRKLSGKLPGTSEERMPDIIEAVRERRKSRPERASLAGRIIGDLSHDMASPRFAALDRNYRFSAKRDGCGACAVWCPSGAISHGGAVESTGRHNPAVELGDVFLR